MGSMRKGLGGFVGGLKNLAQSFFTSWHSITSATPVGPTPDCFTGFIGTLVDPDNDAIGFIGAISEQNGFTGSIDSTSLGLIGAMTDSNGYTGDLCND